MCLCIETITKTIAMQNGPAQLNLCSLVVFEQINQNEEKKLKKEENRASGWV